MRLELDYLCDKGLSLPLSEEEVCNVIDYVLTQEDVKRDCLLSLSVVSDTHMAELNKEWRLVEGPTDVISIECERPDDPELVDDEPCELGDIILAPAYIQAQASSFGVAYKQETTLLLIHGLLHLLGYDHLSDEEARIMESREDTYLCTLCPGAPLHTVTTRHKAGDA